MLLDLSETKFLLGRVVFDARKRDKHQAWRQEVVLPKASDRFDGLTMSTFAEHDDVAGRVCTKAHDDVRLGAVQSHRSAT